jgi:drug/metabolite transporter (DMT)-like permease
VTDSTRGRLYILFAALAWSTAGVLQRQLSVDLATQLAGRALFATLGLLVFVAVSERGSPWPAFRRMGRAELGFAVCMAVSSGAFIVALNHTTVANVLFLQAASPFVAALLAWLLLHEHVSRMTVVAMAVALVGVAVMVGGPGGLSIGVAFAAAMMLAFAASIVLARHRTDISMGPATCIAQLLVFVGAAPFAHAGGVGLHDGGLLVGLGVGQIGLGLMFLALGARLIPAAEVALISLLEVVLGPLWVWLANGERPAATTVAGGAIVIVAVALQTVGAEGRLSRRAGARFRKDVAMDMGRGGGTA